MKKIITTALVLSGMVAYAQTGKVGINTDNPAATLEITPNAENAKDTAETNEGILLPRLSKERVANMKSPATALLVYVNKTDYATRTSDPSADTRVKNITANGFYFYDGSAWQPITKQVIEQKDYELSDNGLVLLKWLKGDVKKVDMNQYPDLANVKTIGQNFLKYMAFTEMTEFVIGNGVTEVETNAFDYTKINVIFPDSIIRINESAFKGNTGITSLNLPNATTIGNSAFEGNTALTSVVLPKATTIGNSAFKGNTALKNASLSNATSIGEYAFEENTALTSVALPNAISIGQYAFKGNKVLTSMNLPKAITIGDFAFEGNTALTSVELPEVTTIGNSAFTGNTALASVNLPKATTIGTAAFRGNSSLTRVSLPKITSIEGIVFDNCKKITEVVLGPEIQKMGAHLFGYNQSTPVTLIIQATVPPTIKTQKSVSLDKNVTYKVPMASVDAYKQAWADKVTVDNIVGY